MAASEAGAEDFEAAEEMYIVTTDPANLIQVKEADPKARFQMRRGRF